MILVLIFFNYVSVGGESLGLNESNVRLCTMFCSQEAPTHLDYIICYVKAKLRVLHGLSGTREQGTTCSPVCLLTYEAERDNGFAIQCHQVLKGAFSGSRAFEKRFQVAM